MTNEQIAKSMEFDYFTDGGGRLFIEGVNNGRAVDFLNDHNAAMMVVEKMREDGYRYKSSNYYDGDYYFSFFNDSSDVPAGYCIDKSFPTAVAIAALKAKGV